MNAVHQLPSLAEYYYSYHWINTRLAFLTSVGWACQRCALEGGVDVHHRRYADMEGSILFRETFDDLIALCRGCHERYHGFSFDRERQFFTKDGYVAPPRPRRGRNVVRMPVRAA